ncbi:MAG: hypothetical protein ACOY3P_17945 [Planctomycetota bacterium]
MSTDGQGSFGGADLWTKMWRDFATSATQAGMAFSTGSSPPDAARQMRSALFSAWTAYCDQFMRSEEFRQMMKQSLSAAIDFRRQMNDFLGQMQHEFQGATRQDVDQLMRSMQHVERRVVDSLERVSSQIDELGERLARLERRRTDKNGKPAAKSARPRSKEN